MIVLSICNHKGGTGKTTSAAHLAAALGLSGMRTLVVDLDPQGFLTRLLAIDEPDVTASSLTLFDEQFRLSDVPVVRASGFDVLPSSSKMTHAMRQLGKPTDVLYAKEALKQAPQYDVVLFDTAAAVTVFSLNALVASKYVVIPVTPEHQPVLGAEQTFQTIRTVQQKLNPALTDPMFLFTQVDARKGTHNAYRKLVRTHYGPCVLRSIIRTSTDLSRQHGQGQTAFDGDGISRGVRDYANAADEILGIVRSGGLRTDVRGRSADVHARLDAEASAAVDAAPAL
jgi:chromosome partitioning protein